MARFEIYDEQGVLIAPASTPEEILADNDGDGEVSAALEEAERGGSAWVGGGGSPLLEIRRVSASDFEDDADPGEMDGDHESALASVYGGDDDAERF